MRRRRKLTTLERVFLEERESWTTGSAERVVWATLVTATKDGGVGRDAVAGVRFVVLSLDEAMSRDPQIDQAEMLRARLLTPGLLNVLDALLETPEAAWTRYKSLQLVADSGLLGD